MVSSATLVVRAGAVQAALTGFVVRVDLADLPEEWWNGVTGGDGLRVQGGTALPVDVVRVDVAGRSGEVYFKTDLSPTEDSTFTITHDPSLLALDPADPLGRNAVWSDYDVVLLDATTDRTGKATLSTVGAGSITSGFGIRTLSSDLERAHQGLAADDDHFYIIDTNYVTKYARGDWSVAASNADVLASAGLVAPYNHVGDGFVHDGLLYLPASEYPVTGAVDEQIVVLSAADLSFVSKIDVSAYGHQLASLCTDGTYIYSVGYNTGPAYATSIQRWTFEGVHDGTITLATSLPSMQGLTIHDGAFWVSAGSSDDTLYRINPTTLAAEAAYPFHDLSWYSGNEEAEGIVSHGGRLFLVHMHRMSITPNLSRVYEVVRTNALAFAGLGTVCAGGLPKRTRWTMGATARLEGPFDRNNSVMAYDSSTSTSNSNRATLSADYDSSGSGWGVWNSSDGWLYGPTGTPVPEPGRAPVRLHQQQDTTVNRTLWVGGTLRATDVGAAQRPAGLGDMLVLGSGSVSGWAAEAFVGELDRVYLRDGLLSAAWIAAETLSWETPSTFYEISQNTPNTVTMTATSDLLAAPDTTLLDGAVVMLSVSTTAADGSVTAGALTPDAVEGLWGWYDATSLAALPDGSAVDSWPDKASATTPLTQATASKRPALRTGAAPSGEPVVRFDGVDDILVNTKLPVVTAYTLFYAGSLGGQAGGLMIDGSDGNYRLAFGASNSFDKDMAVWTSSNATVAYWTGQRPYPFGVFTYAGATSGGASSLRRNGVVEGIGNWSAASLKGLSFGGRYSNTRFMSGDVGEVLIYTRVLTPSEVTAVENYLYSKWIDTGPKTVDGAVSSTSASSLAVGGQVDRKAATTSSSTSVLSVGPVVTRHADVTMTASSALAAYGTTENILGAEAALVASSATTAEGLIEVQGVAALVAAASLTAAVERVTTVGASMQAVSVLAAQVYQRVFSAVLLAASSDLAATASVVIPKTLFETAVWLLPDPLRHISGVRTQTHHINPLAQPTRHVVMVGTSTTHVTRIM